VRIIPTHEKYRLKDMLLRPVTDQWRGDIRNVQIYLSRPIIGHTPRKLPRFRAISRFIAVSARSFSRADSLIIKENPLDVKRIFSVFYKIFKKFLEGFLP
jgi:hypothetical protein